MTSIKNQIPYECDATCFIYGPLAAIEGVANLYFNDQFLDYELSVQHILDCDDEFYEQGWPDCLGSHGKTNEFVKVEGVMDNNAYERDQLEEDCRSEQPPDGTPQYWVKIKDLKFRMIFHAAFSCTSLTNLFSASSAKILSMSSSGSTSTIRAII